VQLRRGSLAAELGDLRPGSLRVQTELGDVLVRGTTFSVDLVEAEGAAREQDASELRVVLLSGAVELIDRDRVAARMSPGKALRRAARRGPPSLHEASAEDARKVSRLLRAEPTEASAVGASERPLDVVAGDPVREPRASEEPTREQRPARVTDLLAAAEAARREGDGARARALYAQAAQKPGPDSEVALLRHAGFELESGKGPEAEKLLTEHRRRFPRSRLAAEAAWIHVRALQAIGDREGTRGAARDLIRQFAGTPQARAAERLLSQP
jgi:hypothetical protein